MSSGKRNPGVNARREERFLSLRSAPSGTLLSLTRIFYARTCSEALAVVGFTSRCWRSSSVISVGHFRFTHAKQAWGRRV